MITLPLDAAKWPLFKVQTAKAWCPGSAEDTCSNWVDLPMASGNTKPDRTGIRVLSYSRCLLPQTGTARLAFSYGRFLDKIIGTTAWSRNSVNSVSDSLSPDLTGSEVRILAGYPSSDPDEDPVYKTVFWGRCEYQLERGHGGADIPSGEMVYHLVDGLDRLKRWYVDRHASRDGGVNFADVGGHPGYNYSEDATMAACGNKSSAATVNAASGAPVKLHTRAGLGDLWTDNEAIDNVLANSASQRDPLFKLSGPAISVFTDPSTIEPIYNETVFDFMTRNFSRGKGKGALGLFLEDVGTTALKVSIRAYAQIHTTVAVTSPVGSVYIPGASTFAGGTVAVDVIGDHRFVDGSLLLGDPQQYECDLNETIGEKIQVLTTFSYPDATLEDTWTSADETAFANLPLTSRRGDEYDAVFQSYRIKRGIDGTAGDGMGGAKTSFRYSCAADGTLVSTGRASPISWSVMHDLPLYEGWSYSGVPAPLTSGTPDSPGSRRSVFFFIKNSTKITPSSAIPANMLTKVRGESISITRSEDKGFGSRYISDPALTGKSLGTAYDTANLGITVGIELNARASVSSTNGNPVRRRRQFVPNAHLWVAHPSAIYDIGPDTSGSHPPLRGAGGVNGILRDDRLLLAQAHWRSVAWYGPSAVLGDPSPKRNASWALRCCGDIPSSEDYDGGTCVYPDVGQNVTTLTANGQKYSIRTPVSSIVYDNESGITTWTTDWQDLDFQ